MLTHTNPRYLTHSSSSAAAFQSFPDFSLQNKGLHDSKRDFFGDVRPLTRGAFKKPEKTMTSPTKKWAPVEGASMQDLLWICDQTFVKTATQLATNLNQNLKESMGLVAASIRTEVSTPIQSSCHAINESILELPLTMGPCVQKAVREALVVDLAEQKELMQNIRANLSCSIEQLGAQVHGNHQELLEIQARAEECSKNDLHAIKLQLSDVQQALQAAKDLFCAKLETCQREAREKHEEMKAEIALQLQSRVQDTPVNVDFSPLATDLGARMTQATEQLSVLEVGLTEVHDGLLEDIQLLQTSLPEKLRAITEEAGQRKKLNQEDCDHQAIQTDPPDARDSWVQTFESPPTKKGQEKRKPKKRPSRSGNRELMTSGPSDKGVFASEHNMKERLRQELMKRASSVERYKTEGCAQFIVRHRCFDLVSFFFIVANAIWIGVDLDLNPSMLLVNSGPVFILVENIFCAFFTFEVIIRIAALKYKSECLTDAWLIFDAILVTLMILETWVVTIVILFIWGTDDLPAMLFDASLFRVARGVKMLRLSRMARLLRSVPELVIVIKAISAAGRSIGVISFFILVVVYVFAIMFGQILSFVGPEAVTHASVTTHFSSTLDTMRTLFVSGIVADNAQLLNLLGDVHPVLWVFAMLFLLLTSVTLMYMLIGVMVNVIQLVANSEREGMTVQYVACSLRGVLQDDLGYDPDHTYSKDDFKNLLVDPTVVKILNGADIDVYAVIDVADMVYDDFMEKESRQMSFADLVGVFLNMRGHNDATVKDVMSVRRALMRQMDKANEQLLAKLGHEIGVIKQGIKHLQESEEDDDGGDESEDDEQAMQVMIGPSRERASQTGSRSSMSMLMGKLKSVVSR
eukprot:TRINITY_DN14360_c1_g1_i1.p1 TRINITY_DN14360_c1_g1~~TRINITY_DN14360_c1_g1_i1.p1  ORF type:complete len:916 (-),score=153.67 TRINITY_DN14360_c1_g1_i1:115-2700(-)